MSPRHRGVEGNDRTDELDKYGSSPLLLEPKHYRKQSKNISPSTRTTGDRWKVVGKQKSLFPLQEAPGQLGCYQKAERW